MGDWPESNAVTLPGPVISSIGPESMAHDICLNTGLTAASATWPSASRTIYVGTVIERVTTVLQMFTYNGATASGNVDIGIYDYQGNRLVSMGATAQSGTSVIQLYNITNTTLAPGRYFLAMSLSNTTGTFLRVAVQTQQAKFCLMYQDASSLPATMGFTDVASAYLPVFGAVVAGTI